MQSSSQPQQVMIQTGIAATARADSESNDTDNFNLNLSDGLGEFVDAKSEMES